MGPRLPVYNAAVRERDCIILILPKEPELQVDYLRKWSISSEGSPGAELRAILRYSSKPLCTEPIESCYRYKQALTDDRYSLEAITLRRSIPTTGFPALRYWRC